MTSRWVASSLAAAWLALPAVARAHDLWLEPRGEVLVLRYGHRGGEALDLDAGKVKTVRCRNGHGARRRRPAPPRRPRRRNCARRPGATSRAPSSTAASGRSPRTAR